MQYVLQLFSDILLLMFCNSQMICQEHSYMAAISLLIWPPLRHVKTKNISFVARTKAV